jgi:hypothetical protein
MPLALSHSIDSLQSGSDLTSYLALIEIAATVRQWISSKAKKCLKTGAGEGVRTLDFHLGKYSLQLLSKVYERYLLLSIKKIIRITTLSIYNQFYRFSIGIAAMVRQWKCHLRPLNTGEVNA